MRSPRQQAIDNLRKQQQQSGFGLFSDRDAFDKMFDSPMRTFAKFGVIALVINLLLWGGLIALTLFLLAHFGVI